MTRLSAQYIVDKEWRQILEAKVMTFGRHAQRLDQPGHLQRLRGTSNAQSRAEAPKPCHFSPVSFHLSRQPWKSKSALPRWTLEESQMHSATCIDTRPLHFKSNVQVFMRPPA